MDQSVAEYREGRRLMPVVRAIVESGALYSVTVAVALILFVLDSVGVYIVLAMVRGNFDSSVARAYRF